MRKLCLCYLLPFECNKIIRNQNKHILIERSSSKLRPIKRTEIKLRYTGLPWEWESVGFPMGIPIWDGNGNDFKPMGIPTCGFCGFLWVFCGFSWACLISGTGRNHQVPNFRDWTSQNA